MIMNDKIAILLIEDDEEDYILTKELLNDIPGKKYRIDWADSYTTGLKKLMTNPYDIALIDYRLGKNTGVEIIQAAHKKNITIPFILLTGERDQKIDEESMKAGAYDYLIKGMTDFQLLDRTIRYALHRFEIEEELKRAEEKYRNFFENTIEGIFQTTPDGKLITVNPALAKICGFATPGEMITSLKDLANQMYVKPTRRSEFLRVIRKKGIIANFESQINRKDGSVVWVSENARTVFGDKGEILYFEGSVRDITIRKRVEEDRAKLIHEQIARQESEKNREWTTKLLQIASLFSQAITSTEVADVLVNNGVSMLGGVAGTVTIMHGNKVEMVRTVGYDHKLISPWQEITLDADVPITRAIKTKKPQFIETLGLLLKEFKSLKEEHIQHKNGSWISLPLFVKKEVIGTIDITFATKQKFDKNYKTYLVAFAQQGAQALERANLYELEQQARAESEFAQERLAFLSESTKILSSSLNYKQTFTNVADAIVPSFADWCTIDMLDENDEIKSIAVAHSDPKKLIWAKEYRQKFPVNTNDRAGVANVLRTGKSEFYQQITDAMIVASAKTPEQRKLLNESQFCSVVIVPIKSNKTTIGAITFITTKESDRLYMQDDVLFAEEIGNRASIAIDNARLYEKAQEGIQVRDEFLNIASHELKTPLTSLQLQIQLLLRLATQSKTDVIAKEHVAKVLETSDIQIKRLGNLINNLLDVSKISNRKFELEKETVNLNDLTKEIISRFDETVKATGSKIQFRNGKEVIGSWDKFRLDQVATNLIANAIKYGEGKPITIHIDKDKKTAKLIIKDNGIGIEKEDVKRIFDRFERSSQAKKYGGLGLGLYIANQIVAAHGGNIEVKSEINKGSEFVVNLPI